jgi:small subunit ribosomal protein S35
LAEDSTPAEASSSSSPSTDELRKLVEDLKALDPAMIQDAVRRDKQGQSLVNDMEFDEDEDFIMPRETGKGGFWAEGEEDLGPDEDYFGDDLTSHGHGELEQHRELREYARLIAWELPLLSRTLVSILLLLVIARSRTGLEVEWTN